MSKKPPIINCHIHMFTGDYVPPYLAKTYLPEPFYRLLSMRLVIAIMRWYYWFVNPMFYKNGYKQWKRFWFKSTMFFKRSYVLATLKFLVELYLIVAIMFYIGLAVFNTSYPYTGFTALVVEALMFLKHSGWIIVVPNLFYKLLFFVLILIFFKSVRNVVLALLRQFKVLPGKTFMHLMNRYIQIGLFSKYKEQKGIYDKLKKQYPIDSEFIGLPMDMEFMGSGKIKRIYDANTGQFINVPKLKTTGSRDDFFAINHQMEGILKIKKRSQDRNRFHPFVFADPRRMQDPKYFDYTVTKDGIVELIKGCLMQQYLEVDRKSVV